MRIILFYYTLQNHNSLDHIQALPSMLNRQKKKDHHLIKEEEEEEADHIKNTVQTEEVAQTEEVVQAVVQTENALTEINKV